MAKKVSGGKSKVKKAARAGSTKPPKAAGKPPRGAPTTDQDPKRRLGNFTGTGEAPRKGYRTSGISGPQKRRDSSNRAKQRKQD